jgi:hypothetical protein
MKIHEQLLIYQRKKTKKIPLLVLCASSKVEAKHDRSTPWCHLEGSRRARRCQHAGC